MGLITINIDTPHVPEDGSYIHHSTDIEISKYPDFYNENNILERSLNDTDNLTSYSYEVPLDTPVYARFRFNYSNNTKTDWSRIIVLRDNQSRSINNDNIIQTPGVTVTPITSNGTVISYNITTTPFLVYSGQDTHDTTDWIIRDSLNDIVYENLDNDTDKVLLNIPADTFKEDSVYLVEVIHKALTGAMSEIGSILFRNELVGVNDFDVPVINELRQNNRLLIPINVKSNNFVSSDIVVVNNDTEVYSSKDQTTNNLFIEIGDLDLYKTYEVKVRIKYTNNNYSSYKVIYKGKPLDYTVGHRDQYLGYLDKFNNVENINLNGMVVQVSNQANNGNILLAKQRDNNIYLYERYKGLLSEIKPVITLDNLNNSRDKHYINIIQLNNNNNDVLVDYDSLRVVHKGSIVYEASMDNDPDIIVVDDDEDIVRYRPRFEYYRYNPIDRSYTFVNRVIRDDELLGTSPVNSLAYNGYEVYYIPAMMCSDVNDDAQADLKVRKLDLTDLTITDNSNMPDSSMRSYVNITSLNKDTWFVYNGSGDLYNNSDPDATDKMNNAILADRVNETMYQYDPTDGSYTSVATMPNTVSINNYSYQSFVRTDNEIIMFNAVDSGPELGNQNTLLYNNVTKEIIELENDTPDELSYRNTIKLNNGDFLRISTRALDPQVIDAYVSNTFKLDQIVNNVSVSLITDLIVPNNEVISIDSPYRYTSITILGSGPSDTGELRWIDDNMMRIFHYNDLLLPNDRTIPSDREFNSITFLPNAELTILDSSN